MSVFFAGVLGSIAILGEGGDRLLWSHRIHRTFVDLPTIDLIKIKHSWIGIHMPFPWIIWGCDFVWLLFFGRVFMWVKRERVWSGGWILDFFRLEVGRWQQKKIMAEKLANKKCWVFPFCIVLEAMYTYICSQMPKAISRWYSRWVYIHTTDPRNNFCGVNLLLHPEQRHKSLRGIWVWWRPISLPAFVPYNVQKSSCSPSWDQVGWDIKSPRGCLDETLNFLGVVGG